MYPRTGNSGPLCLFATSTLDGSDHLYARLISEGYATTTELSILEALVLRLEEAAKRLGQGLYGPRLDLNRPGRAPDRMSRRPVPGRSSPASGLTAQSLCNRAGPDAPAIGGGGSGRLDAPIIDTAPHRMKFGRWSVAMYSLTCADIRFAPTQR